VTNTYLVVAHRTLVGQHLIDHCRALSESEDCQFHLVVPVRHPGGHAWTDGEIDAIARQKLEEGLAAFSAAGLDATGETGDENPVYAASTALRNVDFDCQGIIVSTLPTGVSHWLHIDVVSRMKREFDLPITHLVSNKAEADAIA
jgi:GABA permease